jgi:hypothetical protein
MIVDGWEGDPWALSLASGWFGCCWCQKISLQNTILGPEFRCPISMAPKPLLLNHPNSLDTSTKGLWMVGKGIHGLYVLHQAGLGAAGCQKINLQNIILGPESRCPISMAPKPLLLNHPNSLDISTE